MSPGFALKLQCMGNRKVYDSQSKGTFKMGQDGVNLEWTMYESISTNSFHTLYTDTDFADVTLACEENKQILVHKVVVSSCSELLKKILLENPHPHPLIFLQGLTLRDLQQLKRSMYLGVAFVEEPEMKSFLSVSKTFLNTPPPAQAPAQAYQPSLAEGEEGAMTQKKVLVEGKVMDQAEIVLAKSKRINEKVGIQLNNFAVNRELKILECTVCDWSHESQIKLTRHMRNKHTGQSMSCKTCDFKASTLEKLEIHERKDHNAEQISCPLCDAKLMSKSILKTHIRKIHKKTYATIVCKHCDYSTKHGSEMHRHRKRHEGNLLLCDQCEYKTDTQRVLRQHKDRLHDTTEYNCKSCEYRSNTMRKLYFHERAVHRGILYNCESCGFKTARSNNLRQHQRRKHGGERFNCVFCNFGDWQSSRVILHEKRKHPAMLDSASGPEIDTGM